MAIQEGRAERLSGLNRVTGIGSELGSWGRGDQRRPLRRLQIKFRHSTGTSTNANAGTGTGIALSRVKG